MKVIELEQGSAEWLAFRKDKIGGSDAPIIMGDSPYCTPYQLWLDKLGLEEKKVNEWATSYGTRKEPIVREMLKPLYSNNLKPMVIQDDINDWMIASFDAVDLEKKMFREIKCLGKEDHYLTYQGEIPSRYKAQLQHQMMVVNEGLIYYDSYNEDVEQHEEKLYGLHVEADLEYQEMLYKKEQEFMQCLRTLTPPPMMERDYVDMDSPDWRLLCHQYRQVELQLKECERVKEELRKRIISSAGGLNAKGEGMKVSKVVRRGSVEYGVIPELKGLDLEQYRKPSIVSWRIDVKE